MLILAIDYNLDPGWFERLPGRDPRPQVLTIAQSLPRYHPSKIYPVMSSTFDPDFSFRTIGPGWITSGRIIGPISTVTNGLLPQSIIYDLFYLASDVGYMTYDNLL